jgi:hypothetical protein
MPERVQLRRTKGWRMPPNTVKVDRSTKWGNPFVVDDAFGRQTAVTAFRLWVAVPEAGDLEPNRQFMVRRDLHTLRGKNLACWCKPGEPCHADVLLELANAAQPKGESNEPA